MFSKALSQIRGPPPVTCGSSFGFPKNIDLLAKLLAKTLYKAFSTTLIMNPSSFLTSSSPNMSLTVKFEYSCQSYQEEVGEYCHRAACVSG